MSGLTQVRLERIDRILRAMRLSGRRLVCSNGKWRVRADQRRWLAIDVPPEDAQLLLADGKLAPAQGGGYVLTAAAVEEIAAADASEPPCAGPWIHVVTGTRRRTAARGFRGLAIRAEAGLGPLTRRQAVAGLKLIADAEQAGRNPSLTMNWDAGPADKQRRDGRMPWRMRVVRKADARVRRARETLGDAFGLVWSACVDQLPLARLERRHELPAREGAAALAAALEKLANLYDGLPS
jgi:hypothetical protein